MDCTKRQQIRKMMTFLEYKEWDHIFMQGVSLPDKTFPSCNGKGEFFSNQFASRKPLPDPPSNVISFAHFLLTRDTKIKLVSLSTRHKIPRFENLLKKCYDLEFIND